MSQILITLAMLATPLFAQNTDIQGTWEISQGEAPVLLTLETQGARLSGSLSGDGSTFPLSAQLRGAAYHGQVDFEGIPFACTLSLAGSLLELTLAEHDEKGQVDEDTKEVLTFKRKSSQAGANPLAPKSSANPLAASPPRDPFAGTFKGDNLGITLRNANAAYTGFLDFGGQTYPVQARREGERVSGSFSSGGQNFAFALSKGRDHYILESGGSTYRLKSEPAGPVNPLAGGNPGLSKAPTNSATPTPRDGFREYKHAIGMGFHYPAQWRVMEVAGAIQLVPGDVQQTQWGPSEAYYIMATPANGIERPDDPRVDQYLTSSVGQLVPFIRRNGKAQPVQGGSSPGALYTWQGQSPMGFQATGHAYIAMINGYATSLFALAPSDKIEARKQTLQAIFQSFHDGAAQTDPRLVGTWFRKNYNRVASYNGTLNSSSTQTMVLSAEGKMSNGSETAFSASTRSTQGGSGSYFGQAGGAPNRGRWGVSGNKLTLVFGDGTFAEYTFHVQGAPGRREMLLTPTTGGKKELWTEYAD